MATRKKAATNRPGSKKRKRSKWEDNFQALIEVHGWPAAQREQRFHEAGFIYAKKRQWRFDFAWPDMKLAVEIDGGLFRPMSGHRSPIGITEDRVKDAVAQLMGWVVLRFTEISFRNDDVIPIMEEAFEYCKNRAGGSA